MDSLQCVTAGARSIERWRDGDENQRKGGRLWTPALVNIIVEFSGPTESMTLTVIVPNDGDEAALREQGIARAKDFALQFAADRS